MRRKSIVGIFICAGLFLIVQFACTKSGVIRQLNAAPRGPNCDTCTNSPSQIDKEVILYLTSTNWFDRGNGRFECDLMPLLEAQGVKADSANLLSVYIGLGRTATKMDPGIAIDYDGGTLVWFGYKLSLQLPSGGTVPIFQAIQLDLKWL